MKPKFKVGDYIKVVADPGLSGNHFGVRQGSTYKIVRIAAHTFLERTGIQVGLDVKGKTIFLWENRVELDTLYYSKVMKAIRGRKWNG